MSLDFVRILVLPLNLIFSRRRYQESLLSCIGASWSDWKHSFILGKKLVPEHAAGTSINFAFCEEIINSDIPFIIVVYEKIIGSINK